jgi:LysR family transcriptional regulator, hypochlorite-specific transcription factor HypT
MEFKWLEDFVSLAQTGSFSRSAQLRNVTQPAFSRRVQSLESWLGADLIDRTSYPTRLTPAGTTFYAQAVEMLEQINAARAMARGNAKSSAEVIEFAAPHTLSLMYFPAWLRGLENGFGAVRCRLVAANVHDAAMRLVDGGCDLLMCYHHERHPVQLDTNRYESLVLGRERVLPFTRAEHGKRLYRLPSKASAPIPYLSYTAGAYLGRMAELIVQAHAQPVSLEKVYETDMAEGLKQMALEGHGIAFLPESAVARELEEGLLLPACTSHKRSQEWSIEMDIRIYRERPSAARAGKPIVDQLWSYLCKNCITP